MNGAADFLVEEGIPDAPADPHIVAKSEFAHVARTPVKFEHLQQEVLSLACAGLDDFPLLEYQPDAIDCATLVGRRNIKTNDSIDAVLNWSRKELSAGEIAFAIAVDKGAILNRERQIGAFSNHAYLFMAHQPINQPLLLRCQLFPAGDRIGIIEEAGVENELFKVAQRHIGVLGGGMCGVECGTPAKGFFLLAPAKCVCNFTHSLPTFGCLCRIDAAHRFRIASCPDSQSRGGFLRKQLVNGRWRDQLG